MEGKLLTFSLAVLACASCCTGSPVDEWIGYKVKFGKQYLSESEDKARYENYQIAHDKIEQHNKLADVSYKMELNHLSDWSQNEYNQINGLVVPNQLESSFERHGPNGLHRRLFFPSGIVPDSVPNQVNWRKIRDRVSPVMDQAHCGSCWAVSAVGLLEGQQVYRNLTSKLKPLSVQNFIDCSNSNSGCNGGSPIKALSDVREIGGIMPEESYTYTGSDGVCMFDQHKVAAWTRSGVLLEADERLMQKVVASYGPISVGIEATDNLRHYKSGIFRDATCNGRLNHAVLIVGYGTDLSNGLDYWLVKNSWGKQWGEDGFFKLERNANMCGVNSLATVALIG